METSQPVALQPGDRVRVLVSTDKRDPWLTPKEGWEGVAVAPAINMEASHWQIRFEEPWCSLGIARIMPLSSLEVVSAATQKDAPEERVEAEEMTLVEVADASSGVAVEPEAKEATKEEDPPVEEDDAPPEFDQEEIPEPMPELQKPAKGGVREFVVGAQFRVKDQAGDSSGEEHILRRRGQVGTICRICEMATSCVEVRFDDGGLPVIIPKTYLAPIKLSTESEQKVPKIIKAKAQMKLPF